MIILNNTITINVPLEKAFAFLADPVHFPAWNYYLRTVKKIKNGNPVIGAEYHQTRKSDEQHFIITGYKENEYIELASSGKSFFRFRRKFSFTSTGNGCRIDDLFTFGPRVPAFIGKIFSRKPEKAVRENLEKLKELLENGRTTLQDGRTVTL